MYDKRIQCNATTQMMYVIESPQPEWLALWIYKIRINNLMYRFRSVTENFIHKCLFFFLSRKYVRKAYESPACYHAQSNMNHFRFPFLIYELYYDYY